MGWCRTAGACQEQQEGKSSLEYDALGRRVAKINEYGKAVGHKITRFLWDSDVPLHEWVYPLSDRPETIDDSDGRRSYASP